MRYVFFLSLISTTVLSASFESVLTLFQNSGHAKVIKSSLCGGSGQKAPLKGSFKEKVFVEINKNRAKKKLQKLTYWSALEEVAQQHSLNMKKNNFFSHIDLDQKSAFDRLKEAKVGYLSAGENLALNFTDAQSLIEAWLDSEKHRENLDHKVFSKVGIGVVEGKTKEDNYITVLLAKPDCLSFSSKNSVGKIKQ